MAKRIGVAAIIIIAMIAPISLINGSHRTANFSACPNTDYCTNLGSTQQRNPIRIEYSGWPYKVKIGNPDWCDQGVCEGNNYHPNYQWEFLLYNALILSLPVAILAGAYVLLTTPGMAKHLAVRTSMFLLILILGWLTMYATRLSVIWGVNSDIGSYAIKAGLPFPEHLSMASSCYLEQANRATMCARESFRYETSIWHSPFIVYANSIFWTLFWGLLGFLGVKKYAHSRN